jgi:hypothetical protein
LESQDLIREKAEHSSVMVPGKKTVKNTVFKWQIVPFEGMENVLSSIPESAAEEGKEGKTITKAVLDSPIVKAVTDTLHITDPSTPSASSASSSGSSTSTTTAQPISLETPLPTWSLPTHWSRLLSGIHPGTPYKERQSHLHTIATIKKEKSYLSGKTERSEREIWLWDGREPEKTTRLQRLHLNTRRRNARDGKESRLLRQRKVFEEYKRVLREEEDGAIREVREQFGIEDGKGGTLIGSS